jgi:hypothetical protein
MLLLAATEAGGWLCLLFLIAWGAVWACLKLAKYTEARKQAQAQEKFKRENPELWKQQELLKLEKERLRIQEQLAREQAGRENRRRNVGMGFVLGRWMGWW